VVRRVYRAADKNDIISLRKHEMLSCQAFYLAGLSRLPMVAEIVRIPPSAYALGWTSQRATGHDPIPIELLQELAILKEFVSRVCRYGWTSRRQFEETWMAFLSVLSSVPIEEESETDEAQHEHTVSNRIAAGRVALRCITALLLESVLAPRPGNPLRMRGSPNTVRSPHHHLDDFSASINCRRTLAGCEDQWVLSLYAFRRARSVILPVGPGKNNLQIQER
jgi:hypothetical protein